MSYFGEHFWGEKNHGFEVLYHSVKQGPNSTKELADFIRERATIEEAYSKAMAKLSKLASNGTPMGTFAPLWEVFRVSSDKLALCHLELTRKLQDLIKDVLRYGEEQLRIHKKCKEEVGSTLDAVQLLAGVTHLLPKSRENYLSRCVDLERLRRENTSQKEVDKAESKAKKAAESLRHSVEKYNSARADFEQKMLDSALVRTGDRLARPTLLRAPKSRASNAQPQPADLRLQALRTVQAARPPVGWDWEHSVSRSGEALWLRARCRETAPCAAVSLLLRILNKAGQSREAAQRPEFPSGLHPSPAM